MSRSNLINGVNGQLTDWSQINWRAVRKVVRNLRQRIFRARNLGQWKQLRRLQKLMIRCQSNLLLSVRQITQVNAGKQTAGIDKEVINTPAQRVKLVNNWEMPTARPTRRVYIPKANGKKRPLGIPTVKDRVAQAIVKNAVEPEWEAEFEPNSYGFRPGRGCHDAIAQCYLRLNSQCLDRWVLDADIKGFFDNIAHDTILDLIGDVPRKELIKEWLKAGFIYGNQWNPTETGTPQGGVISPLLANIGLHGLEKFVKKINPKLGIIRYADDFVITARSKEELESVLTLIKQWLGQRGLEISDEKTKIVHINEGFNFLGFNLRHYDEKLLIKPQKEKVLAFCKKVGQAIKKYATVEQKVLIEKLNPLLRGFANYYRGVVSKETFSYIDYRIFKYLWRWAKRRHPNKNRKWVKNRYWHREGKDNWTFKCVGIDKRGRDKTFVLFDFSEVPIMRHKKVKGTNSPDDSRLSNYWAERHKENGTKIWAKDSKYWDVAHKQNWKCPICGDKLFNGEEVETHHIVPVAEGGSNDIDNLMHLHRACHKQVHSKSKVKARSMA